MTTTTTAPPTDTSSARVDPKPQGNKLPTIRYTLSQMRRSSGRLAAAGIAILISTAFVTVTLLAGNVLTRVIYDTNAARYSDADVIVTTTGTDLAADVEALSAVDGVTAAEPVITSFITLTDTAGRIYSQVIPTVSDERLTPLELTDGAWPSGKSQVAMPEALADRMGLDIGDSLTILGWKFTDTEAGETEETVNEVRISGITRDPYGAFIGTDGTVVATAAAIEEWNGVEEPFGEAEVMAILDPSVLSGGEADPAVRQALEDAVVSDGDAAVVTVDERAEAITTKQTGGENVMLLVFGLAFAVIALVVAGLVIANTFQVLVAQRTRTLALLRCIGAGQGQLYRSVLFEAFLVGTLASIGGILAGLLLGQGALWVIPQTGVDVRMPELLPITPQVVLLPLAVGIAVTVGAALAPARNATRVAPLAALRPALDISLRKGAGRVRAVFALLLILAGAGLLVLGATVGPNDDTGTGVLAAVLGASIALIGIIIGAVFWLPKAAAFFGGLVARSGPAPKLAAANTLRNPRRTSATATALLIGVTLIVSMATGAAAARQTAEVALDKQFPMDLWVTPGATEIPEDASDQIAAVGTVDEVVSLYSAEATIEGDEGRTLRAADLGEMAQVLRDDAAASDLDKLKPGTMLLSETDLEELGLADGDTAEVAGTDGGTHTFTVAATQSPAITEMVTLDDLRTLGPEPILTDIWVATGEDDLPADALYDVQEALSDSGLMVMSPASERAQFEQIINVMLGTIIALLAVAVVIAVIGVANTLSLSVIERRRESATLRAIGLSKSQLRAMLAVEGMLIAGVGAVLGIVLGLIFGSVGAVSALSSLGEVTLAVPWVELAVVFVGALLAGLVASVTPARAALKASPVEALAAE